MIISENIEILHLLGSKDSKDSACPLKYQICILKWGPRINVINICRRKKHIQFPLTDVSCQIFFHRHCCQFCFPCFHGQYYVTIRHLAAAQNYLLGNLLKHWVSGSRGRYSCSHLSGKFEVWTALFKLTMTNTKAKTKTKTKRNSCSHLSGKFEHQLCQKSKLKWNPKRASTIHKTIN